MEQKEASLPSEEERDIMKTDQAYKAFDYANCKSEFFVIRLRNDEFCLLGVCRFCVLCIPLSSKANAY